jgi:hypothetical protein
MKINGKILDSKGEPLGLANVTIQNGIRAKKLGTSADLDGNFSLENEIIEPNSIFKISYVGFEPKELKASELKNKTIKLSESVEELKGVTIIGQPKSSSSLKEPTTNKIVFKENLKKYKYVYAGLGAFAGVLLIMKSIKK